MAVSAEDEVVAEAGEVGEMAGAWMGRVAM